LAAVCGLVLAGCGANAPSGDALPAGHLLLARTEALGRLAERLARLEHTPIGRGAAALARSLPDCPWVEAVVEDGEPTELLERLACRQDPSALAPLEAQRAGRDVVFALAARDGGRVVGGLDVAEDGGVSGGVDLPRSRFRDGRALLLPAAGSPGPTVLSHRDEIAHARLRPEDGLDVAALVPRGGQADELFRLKSRLFAGAVLDGTWEAALYLPGPGESVPRVALAVGFALADPAVAAMEGFVGDLQATWPVRRSDFAVGAQRGACLLELNVLPGLAPCYVADDDALVIGWNPASVRAALADDGGALPHPADGLTAFLDRIPAADARLAGRGDAPAAPPAPPPWSRLHLSAASHGDRVQLRLSLDAGTDA
jgi:hypothetical protein